MFPCKRLPWRPSSLPDSPSVCCLVVVTQHHDDGACCVLRASTSTSTSVCLWMEFLSNQVKSFHLHTVLLSSLERRSKNPKFYFYHFQFQGIKQTYKHTECSALLISYNGCQAKNNIIGREYCSTTTKIASKVQHQGSAHHWGPWALPAPAPAPAPTPSCPCHQTGRWVSFSTLFTIRFLLYHRRSCCS